MSESPNHDISPILKAWPHESGHIMARKVRGEDDREVLQVRVELGLLQMELEGRPDGVRPEGHPSLLEHHKARMQWYMKQTGSEVGFVLTEEECRGIREEAVQFYHRYVALFSLADYEGVVRDTSRNLRVFDFCHQFAATPEDRAVLEQFRPAVIMMRARAEAELSIAQRQPKDALAAIDRGLEEIRVVYQQANSLPAFDQANEVQLLRGMRDVLVPKLPVSQRAELMERLQAALDGENYELAAILRDELRMMHD